MKQLLNLSRMLPYPTFTALEFTYGKNKFYRHLKSLK